MKEYQIYTKELADGTKYVEAINKEGFNWWAFLIPGLWMLANRMWKIFFITSAASWGLYFIAQGLYPYADLTFFNLGVMILFNGALGIYGNQLKIYYAKNNDHEFKGIVNHTSPKQASVQWQAENLLAEFKRTHVWQPIKEGE